MTDATSPRVTWKTLVLILALTLGAGLAAALLTQPAMAVYDRINKPSFAPPPWLFPVVWTLLYAAMSVALWLIFRSTKPAPGTIALYVAQLVANLLWPFLFFSMEAYGLAFWWLLLLLGLILWLMQLAFRAEALAGWLLVPYAAWVTFAGVLNFFVARLN